MVPNSRATYLAKINDFSQIIQERGLGAALETYAAGVFHRDAIEAIWRRGGIADFITSNAQVVPDETGTMVKRIFIGDSTTITVSLDEKNLLGIDRNGVIQKGTFKADATTGAFGLVDGTIDYVETNGAKVRVLLQNGVPSEVNIKNGEDTWLKLRSSGSLVMFQNGYLASGVIEDHASGLQLTFQNGNLLQMRNLITGKPVSLGDMDAQRSLREMFVAFSSGICNEQYCISSPPVVDAMKLAQTYASTSGKPVTLIDTVVFKNDSGPTGVVSGVIQVAGEAFLPISINKGDFKKTLRDRLMALPAEERSTIELQGVFYSGSGQTGLEAINELATEEGFQFTFKNVILVGAPHFITTGLNGININNLHIFEGTKDPLARIRLNFNPNFSPTIHVRQFEGFTHSGEDGYFSDKNREITVRALIEAWQTE